MSLPGIDKVGVSQFPPFSGQPNFVQKNRLGGSETNIVLPSTSSPGTVTGNLIPTADNTYIIGTAALRWASGTFVNVNVDQIGKLTLPIGSPTGSITGDVTPSADNTYAAGAPAGRWAVFNGLRMWTSPTSGALSNVVISPIANGTSAIGSTITSGTDVTAINTGNFAVTSGSNIVMIGTGAGDSITTGGSNVCIGQNAATSCTTGASNTAVGAGSDVVAGSNGQIALGAGAVSTAANSVTLGGLTAGTRVALAGAAGAASGLFLPVYLDNGAGVRTQYKLNLLNAA
ncbi:MAG TPA: hypothetical protein VFC02_09740 [Anaerolineales bacterium]|nr:hypothetical protein [Anaerolineales bacterium]